MSFATNFPRVREPIKLKIDGISQMSTDQLLQGVNSGGKFVVFEYCISVIFMSRKSQSLKVYYFAPGEKTYGKSVWFTLCTALFGWWGIPWGPIYTVSALSTNFRGGRDVTMEVMASLGFNRNS